MCIMRSVALRLKALGLTYVAPFSDMKNTFAPTAPDTRQQALEQVCVPPVSGTINSLAQRLRSPTVFLPSQAVLTYVLRVSRATS